jgi:5-keto 4-deoxyuronate isomerase
LITDIIQVNILILTHMTDTNEISVYNTMIDHKDDRDTVVLLYENENHFKLVGHFNGDRMISYFKELPYEFNQLI